MIMSLIKVRSDYAEELGKVRRNAANCTLPTPPKICPDDPLVEHIPGVLGQIPSTNSSKSILSSLHSFICMSNADICYKETALQCLMEGVRYNLCEVNSRLIYLSGAR